MSKKTLTFMFQTVVPRRAIVVGAIALLSACAHVPEAEEIAQGAYTVAEQERLSEIEQHYVEGQYEALLASLTDDPLVENGGLAFRSDALKYQAFSQCSLGEEQACRQSFRDLLEENPGYQLSPAEHSHPLWGRIFATESRQIRSTRVWVKQEQP